MKLNLSFAGCGFLGIYHIGVVSAFKEHVPSIFHHKITGTSAGSLAAACSLCDCSIDEMKNDVIDLAMDSRKYLLGAFHPNVNISSVFRKNLERMLPDDAHETCSGKLFVSVTSWSDRKNVLINQFDSREDLIDALVCSSYLPLYTGIFPPTFKGKVYLDGGFTDNCPMLDDHTIMVSPYSGKAHISPAFELDPVDRDKLQTSRGNYNRFVSLFPPDQDRMEEIFFDGYEDAVKFCETRDLLALEEEEYFSC